MKADLDGTTISVIMPVYNTEAFLSEAIESVIRQTYTDWELILVDDGSTDRSGAICDQYALQEKRIRVIHTKNQGVSAARNTALDAARGEWIYFIDSDDWIDEESFETLLRYSQDVDLVTGPFPLENKRPYRIVSLPTTFDLRNMTPELLTELYFLSVFFINCGKLYRRASIKGSFEEGVSFREDTRFNLLQYTNWDRIAVLPQQMYHYRIGHDSSSDYVHIYRMKEYQELFERYAEVFDGCESVMELQSHVYGYRLCQYLYWIVSRKENTEAEKRFLLHLCLNDESLDHTRIRTKLFSEPLKALWKRIMSRDVDAVYHFLTEKKQVVEDKCGQS